MNKWIRLAALAVSFVTTLLMECCGVEGGAELIAIGCNIALAALCAWKNNDFTPAAKIGTKIMLALKDGKITEDEVKGLLSEDPTTE